VRLPGVTWHRGKEIWQVSLRVAGREVKLGEWEDEQVAALVYDKHARQHYGPHIPLNFPPKSPPPPEVVAALQEAEEQLAGRGKGRKSSKSIGGSIYQGRRMLWRVRAGTAEGRPLVVRLSDGWLVRGAGVSWNKKAQAWEANIYVAGEAMQLGIFQDELQVRDRARPAWNHARPHSSIEWCQAALVYDEAAREHHGDDAEVNFKTVSDVPDKAPMLPIGQRKRGATSSEYLGKPSPSPRSTFVYTPAAVRHCLPPGATSPRGG
jgi:hypothetical protein